jgi:hypothetical protein
MGKKFGFDRSNTMMKRMGTKILLDKIDTLVGKKSIIEFYNPRYNKFTHEKVSATFKVTGTLAILDESVTVTEEEPVYFDENDSEVEFDGEIKIDSITSIEGV